MSAARPSALASAKAFFRAAAPDAARRAGRSAGLRGSWGVRICSSRSGVSVATFVVVIGRRRWGLGAREELAMIKLNESKLCMMNAGELWDTAMNPETRTLIKVTLADAKGAMAKASDMFEILMGNDVSKRKLFIEKNAKDVRFLDV